MIVRIFMGLVAIAAFSGCKVDPFCVTCTEEDAKVVDILDGGGGVGGGSGEGGVGDGDGDGDGDSGDGDGDSVTPADELCNELDDDGDELIDEDFDFDVSLAHCGGCDQTCAPPNAFGRCDLGECAIDSCAVGTHDINEEVDDGCEYECIAVDVEDLTCDALDDDCDDKIDENVDLGADITNCGECGNICAFNHAAATCDQGLCVIGDCDEGFYNLDGESFNGCEYSDCGGLPDELCNGADDDCDGQIDEGNPEAGSPCGNAMGECQPGTEVCVDGRLECQGGVNPETEFCDGLDNDCDNQVDEFDAQVDGVCGDPVLPQNRWSEGACDTGRFQCINAQIECIGFVGPVDETCDKSDNDCDGLTDEGNPDGGTACGSDVGECQLGAEVCSAGRLVCSGGVTPQTETCDGLDNDCDGTVDENNPDGGRVCGNGTGRCVQGREVCTDGALVCTGEMGPYVEECNGLDDDCDGSVDENNPGGGSACGSAVGECAEGSEVCTNGIYVCTGDTGPVDELCDNLDNDCDGTTDEGNPGGGRLCGQSEGQCIQGVEACVAGAFECQGATDPVAETCDGLDNDCDGVIDNGNPGGGTPCGNAEGLCEQGAEVCEGGIYVCRGGVVPADELCDNEDNDCDGVVDEGNPEGGRLCGQSEGQCIQGIEVCVAGAFECQGNIDPVAETCDGLDNDCDGVIDNGNPGGGTPCGNDTGECTLGAEVCQGGIFVCVPGITPVDELCDNLDNDCDGSVDEGDPEGGRLCGNGEGTCVQGREVCTGGALVCTGGVDPVAETCDGLDNDCDGVIDNGNPGGGTPCGDDTGECTLGVEVCQGGVFVCDPGVTPVDEVCDNLDNDCDGMTDEIPPGIFCGSSVGECSPGRITCVDGSEICVGAVEPAAESCDGLDNDCDGVADNGDPDGGSQCGIDTGLCEFGVEQCQGGVLVCTGGVTAASETCDGEDNDCDGMTDEGNLDSGNLCGPSQGECSPGVERCMGGTQVCTGAVGPAAELCDGLDNDCDGNVDEGNPEGGADCGSDVGQCAFGTLTCQGGGLACVGGTQASAETCDDLDNDCDGMTDETFDKQGDVNHCGTCNNLCNLPNAIEQCVMGTCQVAACEPGWVDIDPDPANGCDYNCSYAGVEVCNGRDDDCDQATDEFLNPPALFCNANGVCGGTEASCSPVENEGWVCNYPGTYQDVETLCDDLDNDCDGNTDEAYGQLGDLCWNGTGACRRNGVQVCNVAGNGTECNAPPAGNEADEACDNLDNDCDGNVDERNSDTECDPGDPGRCWRDGVDGNAISTVNVQRDNGSWMDVMQFEASRPDATIDNGGSAGGTVYDPNDPNTKLSLGYACSNPSKVPWTNVTWEQANDACCGLNENDVCPGPMDTGFWRLCEAPDWTSTCQGESDQCEWGYTNNCDSSQPLVCNGEEYDADPMAPYDQDQLLATGSFPECGTSWTDGIVYDLSGNAKEWTASAVASGIYETRGGSYMSIEAGRTCDFSFVSAKEDFVHINTGFRCCFY